MLSHRPIIFEDWRPKIRGAPVMLIYGPLLQCRRKHFRLKRPLIVRLWINVMAQPVDFLRCKASNHCRSVDALILDTEARLPQPVMPIKAANRFIMGKCRRTALGVSMMEGHKSLMLHWRSFLGHRHIVIASIFVWKSGQLYHYELMSACSTTDFPKSKA